MKMQETTADADASPTACQQQLVENEPSTQQPPLSECPDALPDIQAPLNEMIPAAANRNRSVNDLLGSLHQAMRDVKFYMTMLENTN